MSESAIKTTIQRRSLGVHSTMTSLSPTFSPYDTIPYTHSLSSSLDVSNLNTVIEKFNSLQIEEKEFAVGIITKVFAESTRESILKKSIKAIENHKKGKTKKGNLSDLFKDLEND